MLAFPTYVLVTCGAGSTASCYTGGVEDGTWVWVVTSSDDVNWLFEDIDSVLDVSFILEDISEEAVFSFVVVVSIVGLDDVVVLLGLLLSGIFRQLIKKIINPI